MSDNVNMSGVISALQNSVQSTNAINQTLNNIFPISTSTIATTASAGTGGTLPATTAGFLNVMIAGTAYKIPIYHV